MGGGLFEIGNAVAFIVLYAIVRDKGSLAVSLYVVCLFLDETVMIFQRWP